MRSANLLNDFAFKYVFGKDCKEANDALKSLLTVFLERKVHHVVVKNSEMDIVATFMVAFFISALSGKRRFENYSVNI